MRITTTNRSPAEVGGDVVVQLFDGSGLPLGRHVRADADKVLVRETGGLTWLEPRRMRVPWVLAASVGGAPDEAPAPCGSTSDEHDALIWRRRQRSVGATIERACDARGIGRIVLAPLPASADLRLLLGGLIERAYSTLEFTPDEQSTSVEQVIVCCGEEPMGRVRATVRQALIEAESVNLARHLADLPANVGTPAEIASRASQSARELGMRAKIIAADPARRLGLNLLTAVGGGSPNAPHVLVLEHNATKGAKLPTLVMIGKGVTHDTGGYNLKGGDRINEMSYDKAGAAAVIGAIHAVARYELPVHVVAIVPLVENALDGDAYKPGDILAGPDDTSIYVENTDAEGRLVLADCLAFARRYEPDLVVDVATLTDAAHVALGPPYAALYTNDDWARDLLVEAGRATGDLVWPMPIDEEHEAQLVHDRAHIRNSGGRGGAASFAAAFLRRFVRFRWAHVDMGGRGYTDLENDEVGPGATGFGTRLLIDTARRFAEQPPNA